MKNGAVTAGKGRSLAFGGMRMLCKGLYCRAAPGAGAPGAHPPLAARHCALTCSLPPPACRVPLPVPCPSRGRLLLLAALALPTHRPGNGVISSAFWLSWNTDTDWTELDVYELGGNATGGPGPGFPYILFMNTHVFRRTGTDITPDTVLSEPCHYVARIPLISRYNVYALDWYVPRGRGGGRRCGRKGSRGGGGGGAREGGGVWAVEPGETAHEGG